MSITFQQLFNAFSTPQAMFADLINNEIDMFVEKFREDADKEVLRKSAASIVNHIDRWRDQFDFDEKRLKSLDFLREFYSFLRDLYTPGYDAEELDARAQKFSNRDPEKFEYLDTNYVYKQLGL